MDKMGMIVVMAAIFFSIGLQHQKTDEKIRRVEQVRAKPDTVWVMVKPDTTGVVGDSLRMHR